MSPVQHSVRPDAAPPAGAVGRRGFLGAGVAGAGVLAGLAPRLYAGENGEFKPRRVGLIGCGWYGKGDVFRMLQVAPVEVVAICDVDAKMLAEAAEMIAARQGGKTPRTYADYQELLKEKDLDIVFVGTPDHWHALPMIAAVESGAHVYVEKPTSVDVAESRAMIAAARKHNRVVQVGTQRRSTPHLVEAKNRVIDEGLLGKIGHVEICCYYHMRANRNPPAVPPPPHFDYETWTGPAPMRPYTDLTHPRSWRAFTEYGNGIVGDMCVHMLDMVRWMLDLGPVENVYSEGGILVQKDSLANISDTQTATFTFGDLPVVWTHRSWGEAPDPDYPWAAFIHGENGTLKASVQSYDFVPRRNKNDALHGDVVLEPDKYPEEKDEPQIERHVVPASRAHMKDFLRAIEVSEQPGGQTKRPVADIEQGATSSVACILANLSMDLGRSLKWNQSEWRVEGDDEANGRLLRPYRDPWTHPGQNA
ncbi:Gfo/Idh/MocA family protein [Alienimonas chondri]|uniref:Inositol 2-dehydrogenase/D-chiro-inositol 3-dehydrogenase n=1 Tax=Alienimonas chondri TaxID=2681879 RepID=A0ABX1VLN6_9PLAN|nr:Gfo/Idh/MocA family oxidoreductase [Alienimonas chondri]NNJ27968.1 Inositol 2-dehydrogenase/D-chiro-inositol 3-dehydrogenase [Alienimonas chondri]